MHLSRVQIKRFRNFADLDVVLDANVVMVGENRVGKSNFIFALRLVLDASLPDSVRQLKLTDVWDDLPIKADPEIIIHLDFSGFDDNPAITALLTDYRLATDHRIARLSYVYRKRDEVTGPARSEADFGFKIFGGDDETRSVHPEVRRRLCLDVLHALRDAESELSTWRSSPLRPLLDDAITRVPEGDQEKIARDVNSATAQLGALEPIKQLETKLRDQIAALAGDRHDIKTKLQFASTDSLRLFRSIRVFIDDGKRSISDASVGSANLALLALKLAESEWRHVQNERNHTIICIEEPEAHLHPHLQRVVFQKLFKETPTPKEPSTLFLTTHSPNISSVAPLRSIVLLKTEKNAGTKAYSLAKLPLSVEELDDLQRYLDVTRAEILFSQAVVFVEGDAEAALMPVLGECLNYNLDELGISVCNVRGTNFRPYVKLAAALALPFVVITDWDPLDGSKRPLGWERCLKLLDDIRTVRGIDPLTKIEKELLEKDEGNFRTAASKEGLFLNNTTLEVEIARSPALRNTLLDVLAAEPFGPRRQALITGWKDNPSTIDEERLLNMIGEIGKGRLAARLASRISGMQPPDYIRGALKQVVEQVTIHG